MLGFYGGEGVYPWLLQGWTMKYKIEAYGINYCSGTAKFWSPITKRVLLFGRRHISNYLDNNHWRQLLF